MTPTEKELREAVKVIMEIKSSMRYKICNLDIKFFDPLNIATDFIDHFLTSPKELPERKTIGAGACSLNSERERQYYADGFNSALDIATQVVAKKDMEIAELKEALRKIGNEAGVPVMTYHIPTMCQERGVLLEKVAGIAKSALE